MTARVTEAADAGAQLLVFPEYGGLELTALVTPRQAEENDSALLRRQVEGIQPFVGDYRSWFRDQAYRTGATILAPTTVAEARTVQFPGLRGVVPGYGLQATNDWGLGAEIRDTKDPHWTGTRNSPATFGHFGRAGTFIWVDPVAGRALVCLTDREFGDWARETWPRLSDTVLG